MKTHVPNSHGLLGRFFESSTHQLQDVWQSGSRLSMAMRIRWAVVPFLLVTSAVLVWCRSGAPSKGSVEPAAAPASLVPHSEASATAPRLPVELHSLGGTAFAMVASEGTQISATAILERQASDGHWQRVDGLNGGGGYVLASACPLPDQRESCLGLNAGQQLKPVRWSGHRCAAQCSRSCPNEHFQGGSYRWRISACSGQAAALSPEFQLPATAAMLPRWRAVEQLESVTAARLFNNPEAGGRLVAERSVRSGRAARLSAELAQRFVGLMKSESAFDDSIVGRCLPRVTIGLTITHAAPAVGDRTPPTDVLLDYDCSRLIVALGSGDVHSTNFQRSRAQFIELGKLALPDDAEIGRLR